MYFLQVIFDNLLLVILGAESLTDLKLLDAEVELVDVLPVLKRRRLSSAIKSQLIETGICSCHIISCFKGIE